MARKNDQNVTVVSCIFFIVILSQIPSNGFVEGGRDLIIKHEKSKLVVSEDRDVYDCVDIYKQPALRHPLLKNLTIQMQPSTSVGKLDEAGSSDDGLFQSWPTNGHCPNGTIPIIRTKFPPKRHSIYKFIANETNRDGKSRNIDEVHEYALISMIGESDIFYGATARLTVWAPYVASVGEFSLAQVWVAAGEGDEVNTLEAGWQVYPDRYRSLGPKLFIFWTSDNYQSTGCYNLDCDGFVHTNLRIGIGGDIHPVSTYDGPQYHITLSLHREPSGNWWLNFNDEPVGFWPAAILPHLRNGATKVHVGGEVVDSKLHGRHTETFMGSGHFPIEGFHKAALASRLGYYDANLRIKDPVSVVPIATNPTCYAVQPHYRDPEIGVYFFYGGVGYSYRCP